MAALVTTKLKWNKQTFELKVNPAGSVGEMKATIQTLTGVQPERQKLSCPKAWKGNLIEGTSLEKVANGTAIMCMGSADVLAAKTTEVWTSPAILVFTILAIVSQSSQSFRLEVLPQTHTRDAPGRFR